jgi:hypothetical protein
MKPFLLYCLITYPGYAPHGHAGFSGGHYQSYEVCRRAAVVMENRRGRSQAICTCRKEKRRREEPRK